MSATDTPRTHSQLKYLHGMVYPDILVGMERLYASRGRVCPAKNVEMVETAMKRAFLMTTPDDLLGLDMIASTPRTKADLSAYIDAVILWAAENCIYVRQPGELEQPE